MLGILILQKNIQKELRKPTKNLLKNLIMKQLNFLCKEKILRRLRWKTIFASMCLVIRISWFFQVTFQINNLKTQWIYCSWLMTINHIMCRSKFLTDLCFIKRKIKIKNIFVRVVYSVLVVKMCWQNIKKIVWALMVNNL